MIVRNKKNGTNILAFKSGVQNVKISIRGGERVDIPNLTDYSQVINKADFEKRGWFEIVESPKIEEETSLDKAKKEVKKYASEGK